MHGAVRVAYEGRVHILCLSRRLVRLLRRVRRVDVLLLADVEVVIDEELAEGNVLLVLTAAELVRDLATIAIVDDILVAGAPERQVIDFVREVDPPAALHELHDGVRAVVRAQVEVPRHLVHLDLPFDLAAFLIFKLLLRRAKDDIWIAIDGLLAKGVRNTLDLSVAVEGMLVQAAFVVYLVHAGHVDDVEGQDGTRCLGQG